MEKSSWRKLRAQTEGHGENRSNVLGNDICAFFEDAFGQSEFVSKNPVSRQPWCIAEIHLNLLSVSGSEGNGYPSRTSRSG